jgi:hypothetical protein
MKPRAARPPRNLAAGLISWSPPLLAWFTATSVILVTCDVERWPPFAAIKTWSRWDSFLYLSIAKGGYSFLPCPEQHRHRPERWCGNAGWFPGYPWIVSGLHRLALPLAPTALAVSWLACLGTLVVLWKAFLADRSHRAAAAIALVYAAFAPGLVYFYGVFPLSLLTFCTVVYFALLQRGRWLAAGIAAAAAAITYPVGLVAAPAGAVWLLAQRGVPPLERLRRLAAVLGPALAALALYSLDQWIETGRWNAYLLVQRKYGHQAQDPLTAVHLAYTTVRRSGLQLATAPEQQTLLVALVLVCVLVELVARRGSSTRADALIAVWAVAAWVVPYADSNVHAYRGEAALLPLALLTRRLPWPLAAAIAAAAIPLAVAMTILYLRGVLV